MWTSLFLAAFLLGQQPAAVKPQQTGILAGTVVAPDETPLSQPVLVILLPPSYKTIWETNVQERLDNYWEWYKPNFARNKDLFVEISRRAYQESLQYILGRIERDSNAESAGLIQRTSSGGKFEFKNLPLGYYKVLASGQVGGQDRVWQESIKIDSPVPIFVQVKTQVP